MKRYIYPDSTRSVSEQIRIVVEIEYDSNENIAAATYKGFNIPEGQLLPSEKDAIIDSQAYVDYESFIESVEDLLTQYYDLEIYYKNSSSDNSFYYGMLAKSPDGSLVIDFDFTLRVSNHEPHRSDRSHQHKKEREAILRELTKGKKTRPVTKSIVVNRDKFDNYEEAYLAVDQLVERVVKILIRKR